MSLGVQPQFNRRRAAIRSLGATFFVSGLVIAVIFILPAHISLDPRVWFSSAYYSQFLPVAVSVMLLVCGIFLGFEHKKANFNLAVFGHTASEEVLFNYLGWTTTSLPLWAQIFFVALAGIALWVAYSNILKQKPLAIWEALFGICLGAALILLPQLI